MHLPLSRSPKEGYNNLIEIDVEPQLVDMSALNGATSEEEKAMTTQFGSASSVGLRHVIEDGVALLNQDQLGEARRKIVLKGLMDIFAGASRGSDVMQVQSLFARVSDKPAVEAFSLLFRYLNPEYRGDLPRRIEETLDVLKAISDNQQVDAPRLTHARQLLVSLLDAMRREVALRAPHQEHRYETR
jgi:hypothetical protein